MWREFHGNGEVPVWLSVVAFAIVIAIIAHAMRSFIRERKSKRNNKK